MNLAPERREHNMARWTCAGSLDIVAGPLLLGSATYPSFGWRKIFMALARLSALILLLAWRKFPNDRPHLNR